MKFPFDEKDILETMTDIPLMVSTNTISRYGAIKEITFSKDMKISNNMGTWNVEDGVLRFINTNGHLVFEFRGLETKNGCVYAVGRNVLESIGMYSRPVLHIKKPLGDNFGICISSHTSYEELAIPKILRSLEGDGFDMTRVVVVIGNDKEQDGIASVDPNLKVLTYRTRKDIFGMTALGNISNATDAASKSYWLLLHDTCEVTSGFAKKIANIDVGLNPDVVSFRDLGEKVEFGLYKSSFVLNSVMPMGTKPFDYYDTLIRKANVICVLDSPFKKEPSRDVYGKGIIREVINYDTLGFKKYRAKASDVRKP